MYEQEKLQYARSTLYKINSQSYDGAEMKSSKPRNYSNERTDETTKQHHPFFYAK